MTAQLVDRPPLGVSTVLSRPFEAFDPASRGRRTRVLLLLHLGSYLLLMLAMAPGMTDATREVLRGEDAAAGATGSAAALTAVLVALAMLLCAASTVLGASVLHAVARVAGGRARASATLRAYLLASVPVWIRNVVLASAFLLVDDDVLRGSMGAVRVLDPFVLASGVLTAIGLRQVHRLGWPASVAAAAVAVLGGQLLLGGALT